MLLDPWGEFSKIQQLFAIEGEIKNEDAGFKAKWLRFITLHCQKW